MNPIDYWYKKYIALKECERIPKPELTWEDVKAIVNIADSMLTHTAWDEIDYPDERKYYEEVLRRFNGLKEKHNGM